jgi:hypothetical protein
VAYRAGGLGAGAADWCVSAAAKSPVSRCSSVLFLVASVAYCVLNSRTVGFRKDHSLLRDLWTQCLIFYVKNCIFLLVLRCFYVVVVDQRRNLVSNNGLDPA